MDICAIIRWDVQALAHHAREEGRHRGEVHCGIRSDGYALFLLGIEHPVRQACQDLTRNLICRATVVAAVLWSTWMSIWMNREQAPCLLCNYLVAVEMRTVF